MESHCDDSLVLRMMSKWGRVLIFSFSVLFTLFLFVLIIAFSSSLLLERGHQKDDIVGQHLKKYKYLRYNHLTNDTAVGMVSLPDNLHADDYISYHDESGSYHLISNFESKEYKCTGSCFCEDFERRNSRVASNVITYLLAALTSVVAYDRAREYFKEECEIELSKDCPSHAIKAEVGECDDDGWFYFEKPLEESDIERYWCEGNCIPSEIDFKDPELLEIHKNYGCEKLTREGEVIVEFAESEYSSTFDIALGKFQSKYLENFCSEMSTMMYEYPNDRLGEVVQDEILGETTLDFESLFKVVHFCSGKGSSDVDLNPSVRCRSTSAS